jgi:hypothetical protein
MIEPKKCLASIVLATGLAAIAAPLAAQMPPPAGEYAREALKRGLEIEALLGTNPYKFGQIRSTDSHTSLATAQEDNYFGKHSILSIRIAYLQALTRLDTTSLTLSM